LARLASWVIEIPPLRARRDDILRLAQGFLERDAPGRALSVRAAEALLLHDWPFNVRQLEQAVAAAVVRAEGSELIRRAHLADEISGGIGDDEAPRATAEPPLELSIARDEVPSERELRMVLARFAGNMAQVAKFFGKDRQQVYRWATRYGIDPDAYRTT